MPLWTTSYGRVLALQACRGRRVVRARRRQPLAGWCRKLRNRRPRGARGRSRDLDSVRACHRIGDPGDWWRCGALRRRRARSSTDAPVSVHVHGERSHGSDRDRARQASKARMQACWCSMAAFQPLAAKEVTLVLANPAAGIEPIRMMATRAGVSGERMPRARHRARHECTSTLADRRSARSGRRTLEPAGRNPGQRFREADHRGHRHAAARAVVRAH